MKHFLRILAVASAFVGRASAAPLDELALQPAELRDGNRVVEAEYGFLTVPMHHDEPESRSLRLAVLVRRSTASEPGPPTFFLNGIPNSAVELGAETFWDGYLELGDVVLFDQRGAGRSEPALSWERPPYKPEALLSDREFALENLSETAAAIRRFASGAGVDLHAFNTRESARDVDALRRALGYERIRLVGHSGGSHLGFEVLREFGEHVEQFVSLGTAGPNDIHSSPAQLDEFLRHVSKLAADDERIGRDMPDLFGRVQAVLDRLDDEPVAVDVEHPDTGRTVELNIGRFGLQFLLLLEFGDPEDLALFPRWIDELDRGRHDVLRWYVQRRYRQFESFPALLFVNRAASGATAERWARLRREAETSPFDLVRCLFSPELDEAFGIVDLGDAFRAPVESDVPTLFVSATLDGKTPPSRAEHARRGFPESGHVLLENGGHNDLLHRDEVHERIVEFFRTNEPRDARVELPQLRFALLEGDDPLVKHPALR